MKKLLAASVYAPSERNAKWLEMQLGYLGKTVDSFDLALCLNRVDARDFPNTLQIPQPASVEPVPGRRSLPRRALGYLRRRLTNLGILELPHSETEHSRSLNVILDYFRQHRDYENYLIMDSDAFPFRTGWLERLLGWMQGGHRYEEKLFAAAVRTENLDTFPHPCVFFMKSRCLDQMTVDFRGHPSRPQINLAGAPVYDVGSTISPSCQGRHVLLPLVRTNAWNPHPIIGGVYGDMFYHHGSGSRPAKFRAVEMGLIARSEEESRLSPGEIEQKLFADLCTDPDALLRKLSHGDPSWFRAA